METRRHIVIACVALSALAPLGAQCELQALPGTGLPGAFGLVGTGLWDADGPGPNGPRLVVGGFDQVFGDVVSGHCAAWDGTWHPFGVGALGLQGGLGTTFVQAMVTMPNGDLVVGGSFFTAGGQTANHIAKWNGTAWSPLGTGVTFNGNVVVDALVVMPNGDLVAAGQFTTAGGVAANHVARWNGTAWAPLGSGTNGKVHALAVLPNGDLIAGGDFSMAGGSLIARVARWNGSAWSSLGFAPASISFSPTVRALAVLPNGDLIVGGNFGGSGTVTLNSIARWNGVAWSDVGGGVLGHHRFVDSLAVMPNGDVAVAGRFTTAGGILANNLARWNGSAWSAIGAGTGFSATGLSVLPNGDLVAIGDFAPPVLAIGRWDGTTWRALGSGTDGDVNAFAERANGDLVAAGSFTTIDGVPASRIARRAGASWLPMGGGLPGAVHAVLELANGALIAGGDFTGPAGPNRIARWSGTAWVSMGFTNGVVRSLVELPNGDLVMGGAFTIGGGVPASGVARWNGTTWSAMGNPGAVSALQVLPNGELCATGIAGVVRWNGTSWVGLGSVAGTTNALAVMANGDLVAGIANVVSRWNGATWTPMGAAANGAVYSLAVLPNGDVLAGGDFTTIGGVAANRFARWDGSNWSAFGSGADRSVLAIAPMADGSVFLGGGFRVFDGDVSAFRVRLASTCPALASTIATACTTPTGPLQLSATGLPWVGGTFAARCAGLSPSAIAIGILGVTSPDLQFSAMHPAGGPGCSLLASLDILLPLAPASGVARYDLSIPPVPAFAGATFWSQVGQLEYDAGSNLTALASSNGLALVVGSYE
jgi:hypothetical protein